MLNFCKSCNNLYTYVHTPERKLIMKCQSCGRKDEDIQDTCVYFNKFVQSSYDIKIDPDQCHDHTLPNTDQIPCVNTVTCPSHNLGYMVLVQEKLQELEDSLVPEAVDEEFKRRGGNTGDWILEAWNAMTPEQHSEYNQKAPSTGVTESVKPRIVFFHYNKDKKLAYICSLCKHYWKN